MATVQSLGLGSGLDVSGIITALVDAEKVPQENQLNEREAKLTAQISAFGTLKSQISAIDSSVAALASNSTFNSYTATSSDTSVFSASTTSLADTGRYEIEVKNRAQGHTLASPAYTSVNDAIGTGTLDISFGNNVYDPDTDTWTPLSGDSTLEDVSITIDSTNNTVSSLRDYINAGDYGLSASIVNDGSGYRLLLTSESGANNAMEISVTDNDGGNDDAAGLSALAFNSSITTQRATQTQAAADANLVINGLDVSSTTNTLTEAIPGVTLSLTGSDPGSTKTLTVTQDTDGVKERIQSVVDAYNQFNATVNELTEFVGPSSEQNGVLLGDVTVRSLQSQIRSTLLSRVDGLTGSVAALADLGILSNRSTGELEVDDAMLNDAIANSFDDIRDFFIPSGAPSDSLVSYVSATSETQAGTYSVNVSQMATQGKLTSGALGAGGSVTISEGVNDTVTFRINSISTGELTLDAGTYTESELADEIQSKINTSTNMTDNGLSATVAYDSGSDKLIITSTDFGSNSTVAINSENDTLGFDFDSPSYTSTDGVNAAGTIDGEAATASGQFLTSDSGNSRGLRISVVGGTTGDRGNIVFTRGIGDQLDSLLEQMTEKDGVIESKTAGLNTSLDGIDASREQLELRMDSFESRLLAQFTAMDTLVSELNSIGGFLSSTLATLPGSKSGG